MYFYLHGKVNLLMYFTLFGFPKLGHLRCLLSYTFKYISPKANLYSTFKLVEAKCYLLTISALWKILLIFFRLDDKNNHKNQSLKKEKKNVKSDNITQHIWYTIQRVLVIQFEINFRLIFALTGVYFWGELNYVCHVG